MKKVPGVRQVASVIQRELSHRFATVLQPHIAGFNPLNVKATLLDPRYYILLGKEQLKWAKMEILQEVRIGPIYLHYSLPSFHSNRFQFSDKEEAGASGSVSETEPEPDPEDEPPSKRFRYLASIIKEKRKQQESVRAKTPVSCSKSGDHRNLPPCWWRSWPGGLLDREWKRLPISSPIGLWPSYYSCLKCTHRESSQLMGRLVLGNEIGFKMQIQREKCRSKRISYVLVV